MLSLQDDEYGEIRQEDVDFVAELSLAMANNRLAPLTTTQGLDELLKTIVPIALILLAGINLISLIGGKLFGIEAHLNERSVEWVAVIVSATFVIWLILSVIGRQLIAKHSVDVWEPVNTQIVSRGYDWFFKSIREELIALKPFLEQAATTGKHRSRLSFLEEYNTLVRDYTYASQFQLLIQLMGTQAVENAGALLCTAPYARVKGRMAVFTSLFVNRFNLQARRQKLAFYFSFFSMEMLLLPLAGTAPLHSRTAASPPSGRACEPAAATPSACWRSDHIPALRSAGRLPRPQRRSRPCEHQARHT